MNFILFLSNCMIPLVIIYVVGLGLLMRLNIFDIFLEGVKDGLKTVMGILPTLIGLLTAVGVLRAADIFEYIGRFFEPVIKGLSMAPEVLSLIFIKLFSSTAATGMMLDIYRVWRGFPKWLAFGAGTVLYGKLFLYHVCVFYVPENHKNTLDAGRGDDGCGCRSGGKYLSNRNDGPDSMSWVFFLWRLDVYIC